MERSLGNGLPGRKGGGSINTYLCVQANCVMPVCCWLTFVRPEHLRSWNRPILRNSFSKILLSSRIFPYYCLPFVTDSISEMTSICRKQRWGFPVTSGFRETQEGACGPLRSCSNAALQVKVGAVANQALMPRKVAAVKSKLFVLVHLQNLDIWCRGGFGIVFIMCIL